MSKLFKSQKYLFVKKTCDVVLGHVCDNNDKTTKQLIKLLFVLIFTFGFVRKYGSLYLIKENKDLKDTCKPLWCFSFCLGRIRRRMHSYTCKDHAAGSITSV